jgi:hypothetical protein
MTSFGNSVFERCLSLQTIDLQPDIDELSPHWFQGSGLSALPLRSLRQLSRIQFDVCRDNFIMQSLFSPGSVRHIAEEAFRGCVALSEVDFGLP